MFFEKDPRIQKILFPNTWDKEYSAGAGIVMCFKYTEKSCCPRWHEKMPQMKIENCLTRDRWGPNGLKGQVGFG